MLGNLASLQKENKYYQKAIELFGRAYQIEPLHEIFWMNLAECYEELHCVKEAEEWIQKCVDYGS